MNTTWHHNLSLWFLSLCFFRELWNPLEQFPVSHVWVPWAAVKGSKVGKAVPVNTSQNMTLHEGSLAAEHLPHPLSYSIPTQPRRTDRTGVINSILLIRKLTEFLNCPRVSQCPTNAVEEKFRFSDFWGNLFNYLTKPLLKQSRGRQDDQENGKSEAAR